MAVTKDDNGVVEFEFERPLNLTKWQRAQRAIYNPSNGEILGRTPKNWGQLCMFYFIFYAVLAAMFAICMQGLFATLDERSPTWTLDRSLIGTNPGIGFRPISERTEEGSLIWYNLKKQDTIDKWVKLVDQFLEPYYSSKTGRNVVNCNFSKPPGKGEVCAATAEDLGNCHRNRSYGYETASPCIFLKLNRIYGWQPEFYTEPVEGMPEDLVEHINNTKYEGNQIWVSCNGLDSADREHVKGFAYYPRGFAGYYYPYKNDKNYISPIVAVEILNVTPNVIVSIECRSWAKNIDYRNSALDRAGSVTFEIQVDS